MAKNEYDPLKSKGDPPENVTIKGSDPKLGEKIATTTSRWERGESRRKAYRTNVTTGAEFMKEVGKEGVKRQQERMGEAGRSQEASYEYAKSARQAKTSKKYK